MCVNVVSEANNLIIFTKTYFEIIIGGNTTRPGNLSSARVGSYYPTKYEGKTNKCMNMFETK